MEENKSNGNWNNQALSCEELEVFSNERGENE